MLPPVVAVLGLLYCANFASVILGEVRNTHTKRNSILNRISGRDKGNLLHPAGYGEIAAGTSHGRCGCSVGVVTPSARSGAAVAPPSPAPAGGAPRAFA